jgi:hypothetical protein
MGEQIQVPSILCPTCYFNRGEVKALHSVKVRGNLNKVTIMVFFDCKKSPTPVTGKEDCRSYRFISVAGLRTRASQSGISKPRKFIKE